MSNDINILAISGSLRKESSNTFLLNAAAFLAPKNIDIKIYQSIGDLPLFNPDLDEMTQSEVLRLKSEINLADGILIASPEYAHGISGVMKNALDWLVKGEEFVNKPVAIINTSSRAVHAYASLVEIIKTMSGQIIPEASLIVPLTPGKKLSQTEIIEHPELSKILSQIISSFSEAIKNYLKFNN